MCFNTLIIGFFTGFVKHFWILQGIFCVLCNVTKFFECEFFVECDKECGESLWIVTKEV